MIMDETVKNNSDISVQDDTKNSVAFCANEVETVQKSINNVQEMCGKAQQILSIMNKKITLILLILS